MGYSRTDPDFPTPTRVKAAPTYFSHTDMGYSRTDLLFPHRHVLELCRTDLNEIWQHLGGVGAVGAVGAF